MLTPFQWELLRGIDIRCPVAMDAIGHFDDLRCLIETKLVMLSRTQVRLTPRGIEALWYHRLHWRLASPSTTVPSGHYQETTVNQPPKMISLADIHNIYGGTGIKPKQETETASPTYKTTNRFSRDPAHPGAAPDRPQAPGTRYRRWVQRTERVGLTSQ
jgi:hypothetical protein